MGLRVYVVEDSAIVFDRLQELLHEQGVQVVGHSDTAATAIVEIAALRPDVVVVDIALREGTGFHVLKALGEPTDPRGPARVVLTNFNRDWYRDAAKRLGVEHFFDKSYQIPDLMKVLHAMALPTGGESGPPLPLPI
ncbi:MAG: response regulator [Betaproteobacteria bacterium]